MTHIRKSSLNSTVLLVFAVGCSVGLFLYPTLYEGWRSASLENPSIEVCFSPEGQCINGIISAIDQAKKSIFVMAYSFTSPHITEALLKAHERGVRIQMLIDKSQINNKYSPLARLHQEGISIYIDPAKGIAHNKVMIIDDRFVLTGSYNWTNVANARNAENILSIDDSSLAKIYHQNWEQRAKKAKKLSL